MRSLALPFACAGLAACTSLAPGYSDPSLENLFNAERAFARDAYAQGIRASFLQHLVPGAIVFEPGPVRYADVVEARAPAADPLATLLEWGPQAGAVSRANDLGFTTGPTRSSKRHDPDASASHGYYFSVWSRANGAWQVVVDAGVSQASPPPQEGVPNMRTPIHLGKAPVFTPAQHAASREALLRLERMPRAVGDAPSGALAYCDLVTPATRSLRNGRPVIVGKALARHVAALPPGRIEWTPIDGAIAASDDLAYTYGTTRNISGGTVAMDGYYVHVWQRDFEQKWKLIADVSLPAN